MSNLPLYLDYNATTPVDERVLQKMLPYFSTRFGNASARQHSYGSAASDAVEHARKQIAFFVGCDASEVVFTSGATESVNLAIKGIAAAYKNKGNHIITVKTEHNAVIETCRQLEKQGTEVSFLDVDESGSIDLNVLKNAIRPSTVLIAVMAVNNETGVVHPVAEIAAIAKSSGILFFTDATQAIGKIAFHLHEVAADVMAFSAHKIYGPKGCGALYVRRKNPRVSLLAQMSGGGQEKGFRSGTLNVPGIVGMGAAVEILHREWKEEMNRLQKMRDEFEAELLCFDGIFVNGRTADRAAHVTNICFEQYGGVSLLAAIKERVAASSGSACSNAEGKASHVLLAMQRTEQQAKASIRFSLGRYTKADELHNFCGFLKEELLLRKALNN